MPTRQNMTNMTNQNNLECWFLQARNSLFAPSLNSGKVSTFFSYTNENRMQWARTAPLHGNNICAVHSFSSKLQTSVTPETRKVRDSGHIPMDYTMLVWTVWMYLINFNQIYRCLKHVDLVAKWHHGGSWGFKVAQYGPPGPWRKRNDIHKKNEWYHDGGENFVGFNGI